MAIELGGSQLEDPLRGSSLLYLLPKTLGGDPSYAQIAASEARELESIKNLFQSMVITFEKRNLGFLFKLFDSLRLIVLWVYEVGVF